MPPIFISTLSDKLSRFPTPVAGLAAGIASIGMILDFSLNYAGFIANVGTIQTITALISGSLLIFLSARFLLHPKTIYNDLKHPVVGSVAPTFAMALMMVSNAVIKYHNESLGQILWLLAVIVHLGFLVTFVYHRAIKFQWEHMVPSWFVPPVGIIVAAVAYAGPPEGLLHTIAEWCLYFGIACYAVMLPLMFYRLIFKVNITVDAQTSIAILAAPASLCMAGMLNMTSEPMPIVFLVLYGIAVLMTFIVYVAFSQLLRLNFSPGYSAYTFPLAIGATAQFKAALQLEIWGVKPEMVQQVMTLAWIELVLATMIISYVSLRFFVFFFINKKHI